jgi:hypothetical protein
VALKSAACSPLCRRSSHAPPDAASRHPGCGRHHLQKRRLSARTWPSAACWRGWRCAACIRNWCSIPSRAWSRGWTMAATPT